MNNKFAKLLVLAGLIWTVPFAVAQRDNRGTARYTMGQSDDRPRLSDPNAIYIWHQGHTFFVAVGGEQRGGVFVRADVQRGSIGDIVHRRDAWRSGRNDREARGSDRYGWDDRRGATDMAGINRISPDVIEYSTHGSTGNWDVVRFDVRGGENIRFSFDAARNGDLHRTIYVGGENGRRTRAESVVIDLRRN